MINSKRLAGFMALLAGCSGSGDGDNGDGGSASTGSTSSSSAASTTTGGVSLESCLAASSQLDCLALNESAGATNGRCYWIKGYSFPSSANVCSSPGVSCAGNPPFERCIFENQNEFAMMPILIQRQEGDVVLVAQFHGIPGDDEIPGWTLGCKEEPTDCTW